MDAEFEGVPVSATDGYTLSTEQVRNMIGRAPVEGLRDWRIEFDRWLAAERAKTWDEGHAQALANIAWPKERSGNPYREVQ